MKVVDEGRQKERDSSNMKQVETVGLGAEIGREQKSDRGHESEYLGDGLSTNHRADTGGKGPQEAVRAHRAYHACSLFVKPVRTKRLSALPLSISLGMVNTYEADHRTANTTGPDERMSDGTGSQA